MGVTSARHPHRRCNVSYTSCIIQAPSRLRICATLENETSPRGLACVHHLITSRTVEVSFFLCWVGKIQEVEEIVGKRYISCEIVTFTKFFMPWLFLNFWDFLDRTLRICIYIYFFFLCIYIKRKNWKNKEFNFFSSWNSQRISFLFRLLIWRICPVDFAEVASPESVINFHN